MISPRTIMLRIVYEHAAVARTASSANSPFMLNQGLCFPKMMREVGRSRPTASVLGYGVRDRYGRPTFWMAVDENPVDELEHRCPGGPVIIVNGGNLIGPDTKHRLACEAIRLIRLNRQQHAFVQQLADPLLIMKNRNREELAARRMASRRV